MPNEIQGQEPISNRMDWSAFATTKLNVEVTKETLQKCINEKTNNSFHNLVANFFCRGRKTSLQTATSLLAFNSTDKIDKATFLKLPSSIQKMYGRYCYEQALRRSSEEALPFKPSLAQEQLKVAWDSRDSKPLGRGTFGTVYAGTGKYANYVFKVPNQDVDLSEDVKGNDALNEGFKAFKETGIAYFDQNLCFITGYAGTFTTLEGQKVLVFERAKGDELSTCEDQSLKPEFRATMGAQFAAALAISHESGCVNRDVKLQNAMCHTTQDGAIVKLIDQGLVYDLKKPDHRNATGCCGTPGYIAPEMLKDTFETKGVAPAADVYSLGISIGELLLPNHPMLNGLKTLNALKFRAFVAENFSRPPLNQEAQQSLSELQELFANNTIERILNVYPKNSDYGYTTDQMHFIASLLTDCLIPDPSQRPTAAQVSEMLQVFTSHLENGKTEDCPSYDVVKANAVADCPKSIPLALREMLFSEDFAVRQLGTKSIKDLINADPSYVVTPSYGLMLAMEVATKKTGLFGRLKGLLKGSNGFKDWAEQHPDVVKELKARVTQENADASRDMHVSPAVYNVIMGQS